MMCKWNQQKKIHFKCREIFQCRIFLAGREMPFREWASVRKNCKLEKGLQRENKLVLNKMHSTCGNVVSGLSCVFYGCKSIDAIYCLIWNCFDFWGN